MKYSIIRLSLIASLSGMGLSSNAFASSDPTIDQHTGDIHKPNTNEVNSDFSVDLAWYSKHLGEGRNQLDSGGIAWATGTYQSDNVSFYASLGRSDKEHYIEWNYGLEYGATLAESLEVVAGYQRIEVYGDERWGDNEFFASLAYTKNEKLVPSIGITYSTEASGYFVELGLHSSWEFTSNITFTPYILQGIDYGYATDANDGLNNLELGLELEYDLNEQLMILVHSGYSLAQSDIKDEFKGLASSDLDEGHIGVNLSLSL